MERWRKFSIIFLCFILSIWIGLFAQETQKQKDESLKYKVDVKVLLIPIIAVSSKGEPVYDLKQEDIELFINGKLTKIQYFNSYKFADREYIEEVKKERAKPVEAKRERVVFIIMDCMFNSRTGFRRTKEITENLIRKGSSGDKFVILQNHAIGGLKYIAGSEDGVEEMIKKMKKLSVSLEKRSQYLFSSRILPGAVDFGSELEARLESNKWNSTRKFKLASEEMRYRNQIKRFKYSISQVKYALKTIVKPKIVFLISEGIARGAFKTSLKSELVGGGGGGKGFDSILIQNEKTVAEDNKVFSALYLQYLTDVVIAINLGGGILYTVNPARLNDIMDEDTMGEMSLMFLANESGGKYFAGSKPVEVVQRIKKSTSAYYELGLTVAKQTNKTIKVKVKSKRKGILIHTINYSEKKIAYAQMESIQKKLFAFNVVTGGDWSRIVGKVVKVKYKKKRPEEKGDKTRQILEIMIPDKMKNKEADIFLIKFDAKTKKTDVSKITREVKGKVKIPIQKRKKIQQYFVIIEPNGVLCIYNEIKL